MLLPWVSDVTVAIQGEVEGDAVEGGQVNGLLRAAARRLELGGGVHLDDAAAAAVAATAGACAAFTGVAEELVHAREEVRVQEAVLGRRRRRVLLLQLLLLGMKPGQVLQDDSQFSISAVS